MTEILLPPDQDLKLLIQEEHCRAELQRLEDGWSGCGCGLCQQLYQLIDLSKYGKRVSCSGDVITIAEDKAKIARLLGDRWIGADQVYVTYGQGYAIRPDGHTFFMGSAGEIEEVLRTRVIPATATAEQKAEYERIFSLIREGEDGTDEIKPVGEQRPIKTSGGRNRFTFSIESKPVNTRQFKARQKLPSSKA